MGMRRVGCALYRHANDILSIVPRAHLRLLESIERDFAVLGTVAK